jgi:hypothetical protein
MERLLVCVREDLPHKLQEFARTTRDGELLDLDIFEHESTFTLEAFSRNGTKAFCPIQQPLMMENLIFRPGLSVAETGQAMVRLAEHAVEEAYRRDAGEVYFLCRDESTCLFAERYGFKDVAALEIPLKCYRLNLRETFC